MRTGRAIKKPPMPFIWSLARYCLELPYGRLLHFPAGSYYAQVEHGTGEKELELMKWAHSAWYTFGYIKKSDWSEDDLNLFGMLRGVPQLQSTRRLELSVSFRLFKSAWAHRAMVQLRGPA